MVSVSINSNSVYGAVIVGFVLFVEFYLPSLPAKLKLKTKYALTVSCKINGNNGNMCICSIIATHFFSCYSYVLLLQKLLIFFKNNIRWNFRSINHSIHKIHNRTQYICKNKRYMILCCTL